MSGTAKQDFNAGGGAEKRGITIRKGAADGKLRVSDLTLYRPDTTEVLVSGINLNLGRGDRLIVMGPAGCGKSSLLRAIGGIWDHGEGAVYIPENAFILSVPQHRYIPYAPLKDIISYPNPPEKFTPAQMSEVLEKVGLERLIPDLEKGGVTGEQYLKRLSGGEQQRLIFARILLNRPDILIMDEISSSLDEKWEMKLYRVLVETLPDTTIVSISHRRSIIPFHTMLATIGDHRMTVESLEPAPDAEPHSRSPSGPAP